MHHTDFAAIIRQGRIEERKTASAPAHYDLALPKIDWDAQWKVSTERAYLSSDPTHPIYLGNNRRFDIDPTWYDLGAESPKKRRKKRRRPADAAAADQIIDKNRKHRFRGRFPKGNKLLKRCFFRRTNCKRKGMKSAYRPKWKNPFFHTAHSYTKPAHIRCP